MPPPADRAKKQPALPKDRVGSFAEGRDGVGVKDSPKAEKKSGGLRHPVQGLVLQPACNALAHERSTR